MELISNIGLSNKKKQVEEGVSVDEIPVLTSSAATTKVFPEKEKRKLLRSKKYDSIQLSKLFLMCVSYMKFKFSMREILMYFTRVFDAEFEEWICFDSLHEKAEGLLHFQHLYPMLLSNFQESFHDDINKLYSLITGRSSAEMKFDYLRVREWLKTEVSIH
tara:strand:+ start:348 stop:830 length:483 start_codon:yes stop_codon:yes gene_type:complete